MGFMDSYKRLEKLCGEVMNDSRRISAYIDEMKNTPRGARYVKGWDEDLKQLKHYRWVRNRIVHDPQCSEGTMCNASDVRWLENFYTRIMNRTDPLTLYYQAMQTHSKPVPRKQSKPIHYGKKPSDYSWEGNNPNPEGSGLFWLCCFLAGLLLFVLFRL